ncbi:MAG: ATP synthase F1 subunit delta [Thermoanaerobaculia bacterium]
MARLDEQQLAVAGVYARALLALAMDRDEADQVEGELGEVAGLLGANPELDSYLSSPLVDEEGRAAAIEKAFRQRASELVVNTLQVMNGKGRLGLLRALAEAYRLENEHRRGEVDVEVTTAVELSDDLRRRIAVAASRYAGRTARLIERVDPELLGGLVLRIGDRKIDSSLARQIHDAREGLFERASQELHGEKSYFDN